MATILGNYSAQIYAIMRIMVGLLFALHGLQKVFGWFGGVNGAPAPLFSLIGVAGVIELIAGLLVALGLFSGLAAFLASGLMAAAYFMAHFPQGFWPISNGGELAVFYCFVFLHISSQGDGIWSLNGVITGGRSESQS